MSFLARTALRSITATPLMARASSSLPAVPNSDNSGTPAISHTPSRRVLPRNPDMLPRSMLDNDPDSWWKSSELSPQAGHPGNQWSGRSMAVRPGQYAQAYTALKRNLNRVGLTREVFASFAHEKKSDKKRRLSSERHRRRFQDEIRKRVALVQLLQSRK